MPRNLTKTAYAMCHVDYAYIVGTLGNQVQCVNLISYFDLQFLTSHGIDSLVMVSFETLGGYYSIMRRHFRIIEVIP